jgi:hypothetical protein
MVAICAISRPVTLGYHFKKIGVLPNKAKCGLSHTPHGLAQYFCDL